MTNLQKFKELHRMLALSGAINVRAHLCPQDSFCDYEVTRMWVEEDDDRIFYSTPSFINCWLHRSNEKLVRNAAYLYDQVCYDHNLF